jgi:hypothetical protein
MMYTILLTGITSKFSDSLRNSKCYGFSIKVKNSKIILKNCSDPFKELKVEEWFVNHMYKFVCTPDINVNNS